MQLQQLLQDDDRAVSPVIGVILMVAITVILAAVIASFVLGLGDTGDPAPTTSFTTDYDSGAQTLNITHDGGDSFTAQQVEVRGDADQDRDAWHEGPDADDNFDASDTISAGDHIHLTNVPTDFEIRLVWESDDGDTTDTILTATGPDS